MLRRITVILGFLGIAYFTSAHIGHDHDNQKEGASQESPAQAVDDTVSGLAGGQAVTEQSDEEIYLRDFPTYHPLVVHFPIVLLLLAAVLQIVVLFVNNKTLDYVILGVVGAGAISGFIAGNFVHPHLASNVPTVILEIFEEHEEWAQISVILAFAGTILKAIELKFSRVKWLTAVVLIAAAVAVSVAGHHGAELTHKMGVGAKGQYLEMH